MHLPRHETRDCLIAWRKIFMLHPAMDEIVAKYRRLDPQEIISTVKTLNVRIEGRFPNSGLGKISAELLRVATENVERVHWIQKPNFLLRTGAALLCAGMIVVVVGLVRHIHE